MIRILTDSASDILPAEASQLGVTVIPLNVTLEDGTVFRDGLDTVSYTHLDVYKRQVQQSKSKRYSCTACARQASIADSTALLVMVAPETCLLYTYRCV